jgi:hypothetical protein
MPLCLEAAKGMQSRKLATRVRLFPHCKSDSCGRDANDRGAKAAALYGRARLLVTKKVISLTAGETS